jgi:hypothetical protein
MMKAYPKDQLYEEMAFLAYYLHWSPDELMSMDHRERQRWCREVSNINRKLGEKKPEGRPLLP